MDTRTKFKLHLVQSGRKPSTIKSYLTCFDRLLREVPSLLPDDIMNFLLQLKERGLKATYINDFLDTMRIYGRSIESDIYIDLKYFKEENHVKATMSDEEIKSFLELPPPSVTRYHWKKKANITYVFGKKDYERWTLFFSIMAYSGMRCGEVANLTADRVDFGRGIFSLEDTKTNTPRYVPIAPMLIPTLQEYIKNLSTNELFPSIRGGSYKGKMIDSVDWGYNFHKRLTRLGIKRKNLTPYSLRHSFITRMLEEDVNLFKVQKIVGHRQLATTQHYTHLTTTDIVKTIKKDRMTRGSLPSAEVLKDFVNTVRSFEFDNDSRFEFIFAENGNSVAFKLSIKNGGTPVLPNKI